MTAQETHPGLLAINLQAKFVATRTQARTLRTKAAGMRREAKNVALSVDAAKLRREAKPLTEEAKGLEILAAHQKAEVVTHTTAATELLNKRMPPEFAAWGIMKTRAYTKVLGVLVAQQKRIHPNLPLATQAIGLLLSHQTWSESMLPKLAAIKHVPRSLP
ncbi:hypothetical protein COAQ111491_22035 [Comamonas aquatilis]|uniref:hypothetical protein n=1 Tax=Comamonas aquatilis TaxID=1778406 RepID=UPI0039EE96F7